MSITFEPENAMELANELAGRIQSDGFNAMSKNDFYDLVLHLLDKHSRENFLSRQSNEKNALLLKVKPEKIKSSKLNIYLRYMEQEKQRETLGRLIQMILDNKITMRELGAPPP